MSEPTGAEVEALREWLVEALDLLRDHVVDDEQCQFDHHGGCQTHGDLDLQPGGTCYMVRARRLIARDGR